MVMIVGIISSELIMTNVTHANASSDTQVSLKKDAKLYDTQKIKKIKTKSAKKYFGKESLYEKKSAKVKKTTYKLVQSANGTKSGWMKSSDLYVVKRKITTKSKYTLTPRINDSSDLDSRQLTQLSDSQIKSRIRAKFINFVQGQRKKTDNGSWISSNGLNKVAQERANYVDPTMGEASHYTTRDGKRHRQEAAILDGQRMKIVKNQNDIYESNGYATLDKNYYHITDYVNYFNEMITDDGASGDSHKTQLLGNEGNGLRYYGIGLRVIRTNYTVQVNIVILSADTKYR
ncbi:hypothetical protein [Apilactobacillus kunkeei]|uniref:Uncharacterized protein n=1 Tax=Apilactobacillus kunkeei DSM 12361 = ATCC 700308 TaxID=1423768 RepID=A0A0R1G1G1_9LACO|nr:hypothetical protein [Apilactobacillus kunkeei]KOY73572.1 hypothetical protein RZ79_10100 [Apilactobacillus kunkeei DSM 12361 = ATCC 700308]KRK25162.1 hypothetical protein FD43_GL000109 [Apilactobacillus kunkeei DSM 12361 = ATCC 700308]QYU53476.1 hypothetical protein K2W83_02260 [Apilactobacillus kunkeei]TPR53827.1 hypothetical protein DY036_04860 [Apilactobacillus kunkeei]